MPNERTRASRDGWYIYAEATPRPDRGAVNEALARRGLPPVSPRTYDHYRRLDRHGYEHYIPINELDMAVKLGRVGSRN